MSVIQSENTPPRCLRLATPVWLIISLALISYATQTHQATLNPHGGSSGSSSSSSSSSSVGGVSQPVQRALTLLADTVENLHARVARLENMIMATHGGASDHHRVDETIDRVGVVTTQVPLQMTGEICHNANFTRLGDRCYYSSAAHHHRAVWKDARAACAISGGKLAEPLTRGQFVDLMQYLDFRPSATGFSYWLGGLYPGISWLWAYAGERVTLIPSYWTGEDITGQRVEPGDTTRGKCLTLAYLVKATSYFYDADECGYEKYYICELLEQNAK